MADLRVRIVLIPAFFGDVAQLGERLVRNEEVGGSIPLISTKPPALDPVVPLGVTSVPCARGQAVS